MARRFGSAMISNTDSTLFIYFNEHIRVKAYRRHSVQPTALLRKRSAWTAGSNLSEVSGFIRKKDAGCLA